MKKDSLQAAIFKDLKGLNIYIAQYEGEKMVAFAHPLVIEKITTENEGIFMPPTLSLSWHDQRLLQSIVDQAWHLGIRPHFARETTPEINAINRHLEDMRSLVFKKGKA